MCSPEVRYFLTQGHWRTAEDDADTFGVQLIEQLWRSVFAIEDLPLELRAAVRIV